MKKILLWLFWIVLFLWLISSDLSAGTKTAIFIGGFLYFIISEQNKRLIGIQNAIGLISNGEPSPSYKLDIIIEPDWSQIVKKIAKENSVTPELLFYNIEKDEKLDLPKEQRIYGKLFRFVYFRNGISGLEQIWSDHYKTFIDEIEVRGNVWHSGGFSTISEKNKFERYSKNIVINPNFIGFDTILPDGSVMDENKLAIMPFGKITDFILDMHKGVGLWGSMYRIKKFPEELAKEFAENNIQYEDWDYEDYGCGGEAKDDLLESEWTKKNNVEICDQKMRSHVFKTPYYSMRIKMEVFE